MEPPAAGVIDQVTAVLEVLLTVAVNCRVCALVEMETRDGETDTVTGGVRLMVADPVLVALATLVAVTVTVCADPIEEGAV
jgi:hypothetical protein